MHNMLKMDMYRLFHRKILYVMMVVMTAMTLSMLFLSDPSSLTINTALGVMNGVSMDNFASAGGGLGVVYTLICIMLSFLVCDDFSTGFAKNLFTVHSKKSDYIFSKIISMVVAGAILMLLNLLEVVMFCIISDVDLVSVGGIVLFWIEKWLVVMPFSSAILFLSLKFRNKGLGFLFSFLLGTGGLVMGIAWAFETLKIPSKLLTLTIYGVSSIPSLSFEALVIVQIVIVSIVWLVFYSLLSVKTLEKMDI